MPKTPIPATPVSRAPLGLDVDLPPPVVLFGITGALVVALGELFGAPALLLDDDDGDAPAPPCPCVMSMPAAAQREMPAFWAAGMC